MELSRHQPSSKKARTRAKHTRPESSWRPRFACASVALCALAAIAILRHYEDDAITWLRSPDVAGLEVSLLRKAERSVRRSRAPRLPATAATSQNPAPAPRADGRVARVAVPTSLGHERPAPPPLPSSVPASVTSPVRVVRTEVATSAAAPSCARAASALPSSSATAPPSSSGSCSCSRSSQPLPSLPPTPHDQGSSAASCSAPLRASSKLPGSGVFSGTAFVLWEDVVGGRAFGTREWRSIESFLFHHPSASVRLISDSLPLNLLLPLEQLGYRVRVERIDWQRLRSAETAAAIDFWLARKREVLRKPQFRAAKQSDLVRVLYVLAEGGLYFDLDSIFLAPLPARLSFVTYWRGPSGGRRPRVGSSSSSGTAANPALAAAVAKVHNGIFGFSGPGAAFLRRVLPLFVECAGALCPQPKAWAPALTAPLLHPAWDSAGPPLWSEAVRTLTPGDGCGLTLLDDSAVLGWWMPAEAANLSLAPMDAQTRGRLGALLAGGGGSGAYAVHLYTSHTGGATVHPRSLFGVLLDRYALLASDKQRGAAAAGASKSPSASATASQVQTPGV